MKGSKLMTPLFYGGFFNRKGRKMRAVLEREISDGTKTYHLWRSVGKPDPLRTQGWINEMLSSAAIRDGRCEHYQFFRSKRGKGSQKFFECMNDLIRAVAEQAPEAQGV